MSQPTEWLTSSEFLERYKGVIGKSKFYDGIAEGTIPHLRIGRKLLIPADALDRMWEQVGTGAVKSDGG